MTFTRTFAVLLGAVAVLALSACGSSSDSSSTLDKSALAEKANAICATATAAGKKLGAPKSLAAAGAYFDKSVVIVKQQQKDLGALKPADDVKADWDKFVALDDQGVQLLENLAKAANAKDNVQLQKLGATLATFAAKINPSADALGATSCGSKSG